MPLTPTLSLPYPTGADSADVPRDMQALALALDGQAGIAPVGCMMLWPTAVPPAGWLICNGQNNVPAAAYPKLALVLGSAGGNITLPDLRDAVPMGASATKAVGQGGGEAAHTITAAELPDHLHAAGALTDPATASGTVSAFHSHQPALPSHNFITAEDGYIIGPPVTVNQGTQYAVLQAPALVQKFGAQAATGTDSANHTHTTPAHAITGNTGNPTVPHGVAMPLVPKFLAVNYIIRAA